MCTHAWVLIMRLCFLFQVCCNLQSCQCVELAVAESVSSSEPVSVAIRHFGDKSTPSINCCDTTDRSDFLRSFQNGSLILFQTWEKRGDPRRRTLLCPLNPDCVAIHSLLELPFTGSYHSSCLDYEHLYWVIPHFYFQSLSGPVCYSLILQVPFVINEHNLLSFWSCCLCCWLLFQLSMLSTVSISYHSC